MPNIGPTELIIILVVALLLFGGSRLAGLGKGTGRAIREFKEETQGLRAADKKKAEVDAKTDSTTAAEPTRTSQPVVDADIVEQPKQ